MYLHTFIIYKMNVYVFICLYSFYSIIHKRVIGYHVQSPVFDAGNAEMNMIFFYYNWVGEANWFNISS